MARRRSTVGSAKLQSGERHALTPLADFEQVARGANGLTHVGDLYGGAGRQCRMHEVSEFGHLRAYYRRHPRRADLDQILPSRGCERAADNCDRAHRVVEGHLAGGIAQEDTSADMRRLAAAAARDVQAARGGQREIGRASCSERVLL